MTFLEHMTNLGNFQIIGNYSSYERQVNKMSKQFNKYFTKFFIINISTSPCPDEYLFIKGAQCHIF